MSKKDLKKEYSNGELTVVWKPRLCIHSENCVKGLPKVFQPDARPWIQVEAEESRRIAEQIGKCPSGALSFYWNDGQEDTGQGESILSVQLMKDGPILVKGLLEIESADGSKQRREGTTAFCRCGASENKPYCDGTHKKVNFRG